MVHTKRDKLEHGILHTSGVGCMPDMDTKLLFRLDIYLFIPLLLGPSLGNLGVFSHLAIINKLRSCHSNAGFPSCPHSTHSWNRRVC